MLSKLNLVRVKIRKLDAGKTCIPEAGRPPCLIAFSFGEEIVQYTLPGRYTDANWRGLCGDDLSAETIHAPSAKMLLTGCMISHNAGKTRALKVVDPKK